VTIIRGYKTELSLNNKQTTDCLRHAGTARFTYNWALNAKKSVMDKNKGKPKEQWKPLPNAIELHRLLNQLKQTDFPWMYCSSKCAPQEALRNLDKAFANFFRKCKLRKQGKFKGKCGFPKFKSKKKGIGSFRLTGTIKVFDGVVQLPNMGKLKLKERGYIPTNAKILSATVSEHAGRWFVSIQVEEDVPEQQYQKDEHSIVGVDLGVKTLANVSDGTSYTNPKALKRNLRKLKRLSRSVSRKTKGGRNRKKAVRKLAHLHYRISCIRRDVLHKITTHLTKTKSVIGIENLNVSGMLRNHCLAQAIADVGFGEWRRQLEYKGNLYNCKIVVVDRFFPSSKLCSVCGAVNEELTLADRKWVCGCGVEHDRDFNASVNLEHVAASSMETINACEVGLPLAVRK
jgi:putative transposase